MVSLCYDGFGREETQYYDLYHDDGKFDIYKITRSGSKDKPFSNWYVFIDGQRPNLLFSYDVSFPEFIDAENELMKFLNVERVANADAVEGD